MFISSPLSETVILIAVITTVKVFCTDAWESRGGKMMHLQVYGAMTILYFKKMTCKYPVLHCTETKQLSEMLMRKNYILFCIY